MKNNKFTPEIKVGLQKYRIEVYIPIHLPHTTNYLLYQRVQLLLEENFSKSFGGATTTEGMGLFYREKDKKHYPDQVAIIYTDTNFSDEASVEEYIKSILKDIAEKLEKELAILITYYPIKHALLTRREA